MAQCFQEISCLILLVITVNINMVLHRSKHHSVCHLYIILLMKYGRILSWYAAMLRIYNSYFQESQQTNTCVLHLFNTCPSDVNPEF